jgi:hypothetical protein
LREWVNVGRTVDRHVKVGIKIVRHAKEACMHKGRKRSMHE